MSFITILSNKVLAADYSDKTLSYNPKAYWPLNETSGSVARCLVNSAQNGVYTGVTLGDGVGPDGSPCPFFDGANDYVNIWTTALHDAFNGSEGTVAIWAKVNAVDVWTNGAVKYIFQLNAAAAVEYARIYKSNTNNRMSYRYQAGGVTEGGDENGLSETDWMHLALTWSKSADEVRYWRDGAEVATVDTSLGTWVGSIDSDYPIIGASSTIPGGPWHGWLSNSALWGRALAQPEIADLARV